MSMENEADPIKKVEKVKSEVNPLEFGVCLETESAIIMHIK